MKNNYIGEFSSNFIGSSDWLSIYAYSQTIESLDDLERLGIYYQDGVYLRDVYVEDGTNAGYALVRMTVQEDSGSYNVKTRGIVGDESINNFVNKAIKALGAKVIDTVATVYPIVGLLKTAADIGQDIAGFNIADEAIRFVIDVNGKSEYDTGLLDIVYNYFEVNYGPVANKYGYEQKTLPDGYNTLTEWDNSTIPETMASLNYDGSVTYIPQDSLYQQLTELSESDNDLKAIMQCENVRIFIRTPYAPDVVQMYIYGYDLLNNTVVATTESGTNQHYGVTLTHYKTVSYVTSKSDYADYPTLHKTGAWEADKSLGITLYNYPKGGWFNITNGTTDGGVVSGTVYDSISTGGTRKPYDIIGTWTSPNWGSDGFTPLTITEDPETQPDAQDGTIPDDVIIGVPPVPNKRPPVKKDVEDPTGTEPEDSKIDAVYGLFTVHKCTYTDLLALGNFLWQEDNLTAILNMFKNNPMDGIISLHQMYFNAAAPNQGPVKLGYVTVKKSDGTALYTKTVNDRYQTLDCGYVSIKRVFNDVRDFQTNFQIYLPFIGFKDLSATDLISPDYEYSYLYIKYHIDILTGDCLAILSINRDALADKKTLYTFGGNCSNQLPLTGADKSRLYHNIVNMGVTAMSAVASAGATLPGFLGAAVNTMMNPNAQIEKSGNISGNHGAMGYKKPYLIIARPQPYDAVDRQKYIGLPANLTIKLGELSGYVKVLDCHVEAIKYATDAEKQLIYTMLKQGVII